MITVVCIEPENAGNLGAIARCMKNFDCASLILVHPLCDHLSKEALDRATKAKAVLTKARVVKAYDMSFLDEFDYVIGTTAKIGRDYNVNRVPITPAELAKNAGNKSKIAIILGREGIGLTNKEIEQCDCIVAIPASASYPTMNISHAAAIVLYELFQASPSPKVGETITRAAAKEKDQIMKMVNAILDEIDWPALSKKETQQKVWRRLLGKSFLTKREAYALMGFLKKVREKW